MQEETDIAKQREYCRQHYHYQQLVERERQQAEENEQVSLQTLVDMLRSAITLPIASVKEIAMRQVERMLAQLKERYRYLGVLKKQILEILTGVNDMSVVQRQEMIDWVEQLST